MYLLIFEDGALGYVTKITDELTDACDDGILEIVDISAAEPLQFYDGEWIDIKNVE